MYADPSNDTRTYACVRKCGGTPPPQQEEGCDPLLPIPPPTLSPHDAVSGSITCPTRGYLSDLKTLLADDVAIELLLEFCITSCSVEQVLFWLELEQYRHFDGPDEDQRGYAQNILHKYIATGAELYVHLPKPLRTAIVALPTDSAKLSSEYIMC